MPGFEEMPRNVAEEMVRVGEGMHSRGGAGGGGGGSFEGSGYGGGGVMNITTHSHST